jgi:aminoglycoside phosphotransferase (APT) family kinase protein
MTVSREGDYVLKTYASENAGLVSRMILLSSHLRASGLCIPETSQAAQNNGIKLSWIEGPTLRDCLKGWFVHGDAEALALAQPAIAGAIRALRQLHESPVLTNAVPWHEPFNRIDARINIRNGRQGSLKTLMTELRAKIASCIPGTHGQFLLHGDFHSGQAILESTRKRWWLIDLDDSAIGHREFDIANFCAHVATSVPLGTKELLGVFHAQLDVCQLAYGQALDQELLKTYGALSCLRRALKFEAKGLDSARVMSSLRAAAILAA